jgi:hypothetical protein
VQDLKDQDEFYLVVDSANNIIHHYRYRSSVAKWEFIGGHADYVTTLPTSPRAGDEVYFVTDATYDTVSLLRYTGTEWHQVGVPPYVTSLPTPPFDGFEVFYAADASSGVVWHLRYRSGGGTYKWEYVGGPPMFDEVTTVQSRTNIAYGALTTAGPSVTVPLAGEYEVWIGATVTPPAGVIGLMSYDIGGTGAADADAVRVHGNAAQASCNRPRVKTISSASTALVSKYRETVATGTSWQDRWMSVRPVRVG